MGEESSGSIDNFKDRYDSDRYYPTNNSDEEGEPSHDHRTKSRKHAPILEEGEDRISTYLTASSSLFSRLCTLKKLSKHAFYPKDGHIFGPPYPIFVSQILSLETPK